MLRSHRLKITSLQKQVTMDFGQDVLNIVSGQGMYDTFHKNDLMTNGVYVPFNEAMCTGRTTSHIFSDHFISTRAKSHETPIDAYQEIVMKPLAPLLNQSFQCIVLWFGADMFCQMNLLTILAYLRQNNFHGEMIIYLTDEHTYEVEKLAVYPINYESIYKCVLLEHRKPTIDMMPALWIGIQLYLKYLQPDNEIIAYISDHQDVSHLQLLQNLFQKFPHYGLGDLQYIQMITKAEKG